MNELTYSIADEVFTRFPDYLRGVVLVYDVRNGASSAKLVQLLRDEAAKVRERLNMDFLTADPRQANHTLTLPETIAIEFNIDGLPPVTEADVEVAAREVIELVKSFCGGRMRFEILSMQNPRLQLSEEGQY